MKHIGTVYLVGAGPGDPGLLTLKGKECLQKADVIAYDFLANPSFLKLAPAKAEKIYVGKKGAYHAGEQNKINDLLISLARQGKIVVRLKGGDPFIFGRGGEEAEAMAAAGVSFEVVPGVTSAIAVPAYAGIPLTHRDFSSSVIFVTGHEKDQEGGGGGSDWAVLARIQTVVFFMGFANLLRITENLIAAGRDPQTSVAVIEWGTMARQKTAVGSLQTIVQEVASVGIRPPTIIVVGDVVKLREKITWFEKKPLFGKRILVTRASEQAGELSALLKQEGAQVVEVPTIELQPPRSWKPLDQAIRSLKNYDDLVFTSANGVEAFFSRLRRQGKDVRNLDGIRIAVIGPGTATAVEGHSLKVDLKPKDYRAEGLLKVFQKKKISGRRILFVRAEEGRDVLVEGLKKYKCRVDLVPAYRMVCPRGLAQALTGILSEKKIDWVVFTSSSTARNFVQAAGDISGIPVASIGPVTSQTLRELGVKVSIQPRQATIPALVAAILKTGL